MVFQIEKDEIGLRLEILRAGEDYSALLTGGEKEHIGSVAIAVPRASLTGDGSVSCTSSVINIVGHKDEALCRRCAERICMVTGRICVCTGGVHYDNIAPEKIGQILDGLEELLNLVCEKLL